MQQQREIGLCVPHDSPIAAPAPSIATDKLSNIPSKLQTDVFSNPSGGFSFIIILSIGMMLLTSCALLAVTKCACRSACADDLKTTVLILPIVWLDIQLTMFALILLAISCCGKRDQVETDLDELLRQPRVLARLYAPVAAVNLLAIWMVTWFLNPLTMAAILSMSCLAFFIIIYSLFSTDHLPKPPPPPQPSTPASLDLFSAINEAIA